jgi:hypothetical protein
MNVRRIVIVIALTVEIFVLGIVFREGRTDPNLRHETDIRLTYKRYMELYPTSKVSYAEYKKLQTKQAFRRSVSSRKIKRMVR